jgi:hypothetical protein
MTKEEIAELIDKMPQDMDVNDFIHELVNRALEVERKWVGLTDKERADCWRSSAFESAINIEQALKRNRAKMRLRCF